MLTVRAQDAPLIDVLRAIARAADVEPKFRGDLSAPVNRSFGPVPLDQDIRRLAGEHTLLMIHEVPGDISGRPRLTELRVYGPVTAKTERSRRISEVSLLERITEDLAGPNPAHRVVAVRRAADLDRDVALDLLDSVLAEESVPVVRLEAVATLGRVGGDAATKRLAKRLTDRDPAVRTGVVRTLGAVDGQRAMMALGQVVFGAYDADMRKAAVRALVARGGEPAAAFLQAAANDEDSGVREAALAALSGQSDRR